MKNLLILLPLLALSSCNYTPFEKTAHYTFKAVGSQNSNHKWIYLCGLVTSFKPEYMPELKTLDVIGKELDITFLAMIPTHRCPALENRLCWPQDNRTELLKTHHEIMASLENQDIVGYIGFSNGGFFLNMIAQLIPFDKPAISIGAAGTLFDKNGPNNTIYLLIGKQDTWHYSLATEFYKKSTPSNLNITIIEHTGGHEIPKAELSNILSTIKLNKK